MTDPVLWFPMPGSNYLLADTEFEHRANVEAWHSPDYRRALVKVSTTTMVGGAAEAFVEVELSGDESEDDDVECLDAAVEGCHALFAIGKRWNLIVSRDDILCGLGRPPAPPPAPMKSPSHRAKP